MRPALVILTLAVAAMAAELRFDGILGQSEPAGAEPLDFVGVSGLVNDNAGKLWAAAGARLYRFEIGKDGAPRRTAVIRLPASATSRLGIRFNGRQLYVPVADGKLYVLDGEGKLVEVGDVGRKAMSFAVAPAALDRGWARRARVLVLTGDAIHDLEGNVLLELERPADVRWNYREIGFEPSSGDLLVASYYPDAKVYRYRPDGTQVTADWWPRPAFTHRLQIVGGMAWALTHHGGIGLAANIIEATDAPRLATRWTYPITGIARDASGRWWLGSTQGIVRCARPDRPGDYRLGGLPGIDDLTVTPDGTLLILAENGARVLRLYADDRPYSPLLNAGNEPWRVGAGWTARATAIAWNGDGLLLTDRVHKRLWHFGPENETWTPLTEPDSLPEITGLAAGDGLVWLRREGNVLALPRNHLDAEPTRTATGIAALAAEDDHLLYLATETSVQTLGDDPLDLPDARIVDLAATPRFAAVSDGNGRLLAVSPTGKIIASIAADAVPGGCEPGAVAAFGRWIFVADRANHRLLRFVLR